MVYAMREGVVVKGFAAQRAATVAVSMPRWMALNKNEQLQKASFSSIHAFKDSVSP